jgi:hypothetical protein
MQEGLAISILSTRCKKAGKMPALLLPHGTEWLLISDSLARKPE